MSPDLDSLSNRMEATEKEQTQPLLSIAWRDQQHKAILSPQKLTKAVTVIRSKSKTRQLVALCERVTCSVQQSDDWSLKYARLLRSPVWKLVSDEAIRKAHSKCECWGCTGRATQVHLLEFPEAHLEPHFDWMNRNRILIALCSHHYEIVHQLLMKKAVLPTADLPPECGSVLFPKPGPQ